MSAARPSRPIAVAYAALWSVTLTAAGVAHAIAVAAQPTPTRPRDGSLAETLDILTTNARLAAVTLAAALLLPIARDWRAIFDIILSALFTLNAAVVDIAIAQHGPSIFPWLAHLPLEWAGFAIAAGTYLHARHTPLPWSLTARYALPL